MAQIDWSSIRSQLYEVCSLAMIIVSPLLNYSDIYHNDRTTKARSYLAVQEAPGVHNIFNATDKGMHRSKRKLISPVITDRSMRTFEPILLEQIDIFLNSLLSSQGAINMKDLSQRLGYDVIALLSFGYPLKLQTDQTNRFLPKAIARDMVGFNVSMQIQLIPWLRLQFPLQLMFFPMRMRFFRLLGSMIQSRTTEPMHAKKDFYSFVAESLNNDASMTQASELWSEAIFFFIAGSLLYPLE